MALAGRRLCAAAALLAVCLGVGCSSAPYYRWPVELSVQSADPINKDMPVAVEVAYVYDPSLTDTLASMSASKWFQRRQDLAWRHPDGFEWWRWEWTPGQSVSSKTLPMVFFTRSVFVFAGYRSSGTHRTKAPPFRPLQLELNRTNLQVRVSP